MELGIHIREGSFEAYLAAARWAEDRGLAAIAVPDHYWYPPGPSGAATPAHDALTVMAGLARETSSIELVVLVSPVTFRHPAVLAKTAATIDEMAGGRLLLGVGTGWMAAEHDIFGLHLPEIGPRFEELEEQLGYLRAAADGRAFSGDRHRLGAEPLRPVGPRRLLVGGTGTKKTPALAGRYADEFNAYPAEPEAFANKLEIARSSAATAGRDPGSLRISSSGVAVGGPDTRTYRRRLDAFAERVGSDADAVEASLADRHAPHGTWDAWRETLDAYATAGVARFYLQVVGGFDEPFLDEAVEHLSVTRR